MRPLGLAGLLFLAGLAPAAATAAAAAAPSEFGEVSFANSGSPAAQEPFRRGLALLHDFEYPDAAEAFRHAQAADPGFALAYWGEAMTYNHPVWMEQDLGAAQAALARLGATPEARLAKAGTERERDYLRAVEILYGSGGKEERDLRYADAMAALHRRYPDDVDATAFAALALLGTAHQGRDFATYMRSAALLEEVLPAHPLHPGVLHYLIHSYDDPIHAPLGLRAARVYGGVAPDAGHALHMTSHIFIALGLWDDVIAANEKAMAVVNHHLADHGKGHRGCGHYVSWLDYAYLQEHRFEDAERQLGACREMAAHAVHPAATAPSAGAAPPSGAGPHGAGDDTAMLLDAAAEMRLVHAVETGRWDPAEPFKLPADGFDGPRFTLAYGEALVAAGGDLPAFQAAAARLRERQKERLAAIAARRETAPFSRRRAEIAVRQIDALEAIRLGRKDEGIAQLRQAAETEGAMAFEFGPPAIEKPTFELLGDELLALGRPAEAAAAYRSALARAPGRTRSLEGLLRSQQALQQTADAGRTEELLRRYVRTPAPARAGGSAAH